MSAVFAAENLSRLVRNSLVALLIAAVMYLGSLVLDVDDDGVG